MSLIPPAPEPERHEMVREEAGLGEDKDVTRWRYRDATLWSNDKRTLWNLKLEGLPMGKAGMVRGLGNDAIARSIVDSWTDHRRLPPPYVMPKVADGG